MFSRYFEVPKNTPLATKEDCIKLNKAMASMIDNLPDILSQEPDHNGKTQALRFAADIIITVSRACAEHPLPLERIE
jgi:hypothetical protein